MPTPKPQVVHAVYRPKQGKEEQLRALLERHWATLSKERLVTDEPALLYRARDPRTGSTFFIEIFSWRDDQVAASAHQREAVMDLWEPMAALLESGRSPELTVIEPLAVDA